MNAEELIGSGMLEAYVMGQLHGDEAALVERMRASDARVRTEIEAIELALEQAAMAGAVEPPPSVKDAVLARTTQPGPRSERSVPEAPSQQVADVPPYWRWLAAASVAALIGSAYFNFRMMGELREVRQQLVRMEDERSVLAQELQVQRAALSEANGQLAVVLAPASRTVDLSGTANAPQAKARVYWDEASHAVHLAVSELPTAPAGKQYQLWALLDGKPVDAGVFDASGRVLWDMKDVSGAQAFAVTIEDAGGSPTPTLETMVLMGQV